MKDSFQEMYGKAVKRYEDGRKGDRVKKCVITCYFGKLPNYFDLFIMSCGNNREIDWYIITDNYINTAVNNIKVINCTFCEFTARIQSRFCFPVELSTPYKWCDYKAAIGYIFPDIISGYDYWGFCDVDLIWGDLSKFYPDQLIKKYDRFLINGHIQFYRNKREINELFMKPLGRAAVYKTVFRSKHNFGFDEEGSISITQICKRNPDIKVYTSKHAIADVCPYGNRFRLADTLSKDISYFKIDSGCVFASDGVQETEYAYVHFQKRKFVLSADLDPYKTVYIRFNDMANDLSDVKGVLPREIKKPPSKIFIMKNRVYRAGDLIRYFSWESGH